MAKLNHIGIAVADLPQVIRLFSILGIYPSGSEAVPEQGVVTHFLPFESEEDAPPFRSSLELLEVSHPEGAVAKFLQKRGPGIHHLSFRVNAGELGSLSDRLRKEGFRLIYDTPRDGAEKMRVNFIHPSTAGGMLIEIMEPAG